MKSYHVNLGAGLEGLHIQEHDIPTPGSGEVLMRVRACSLNYREMMIVFQGFYPLPIASDVIPVSDGAGEIVEVGAGVTKVKRGDRVTSSIFPNWIDGPFGLDKADQLGGSLNGMLSEYVVLKEESVVPIPDHMSYEEAATLPCAAVTAWNALTGDKQLKAGHTVLTIGSGGVSLFALQFAKLLGARVIATTSNEHKAKRLKLLGADEIINYRTAPDWHLAVREMTDGRGVDRVVEVGGAGTLEKSILSTAFEGHISLIGGLANDVSKINFSSLTSNVFSLRSIAVGSKKQFDEMIRLIAENELKPVIDRVFSFIEAPLAFQYYKEEPSFGKVVIQLN